MTQDLFRPLLRALDAWAETGRRAPFWLRDDDAQAPTPALDRLLALTADHHVPLTLAVVPQGTGAALAEHLTGDVTVAVHGWSHANHAPVGQKKQELGLHRPQADVLDDLAEGLRKLRSLHGARCLPLLVPPWNRIDRALLAALPALGFTSLSVFGPETAGPLPELNTHIDPIDWHGTRSLRDEGVLIAQMVARLGRIESAGSLGVMTHHLVHDAAIWDFVERLFEATARHPGCRWHAAQNLLGVQTSIT